jgi:hypothetical protein
MTDANVSDDGAAGELVWLYEDGGWKLATDPITWDPAGDDVRAKYAEAGYSEASRGAAEPFLSLGLGSELGLSSEAARPAAQLNLFVRRDYPQCLIDVEGPATSTRTVYAARFPDGLDLLARWAPLAQAGVLTALASDLVQPSVDHRGGLRTPADGLVESAVRRAARVL